MRNVRIDRHDALEIIQRKEGHFFERKALGVDGRSVQKTAIAFANADGGEFVVGVSDEKEEPKLQDRWKGAEKPEDYNGLLQSICEVNPTLSVMYEAIFSEGFSGYLLFYITPSAALPRRCAVKITRYETREDDPERDHLSEQQTEGCLYPLIHNTVDEITRIMSNVSIWTAEGMKKVSYPPETIWEIVTNAIIHRDYSISDDVQILIFDNRIEVLSPGKLPGYVSVENILDARYSRNPKIVRTLNRYKEPPNKDLGDGLKYCIPENEGMEVAEPHYSRR